MSLFSKLFGTKESIKTSSQVPTVAQQVNDAPAYQGDYAKAVFLWTFSKASPIKEDDEYARYLLYECGIRNASAFHKKMVREGFLQESQACDMVAALKMSEIKTILSDLGLQTTGKKEALVQRVIENIDSANVRQYFPITMYSISDTGKTFLAEHEGYILLHRHRNWDISWQEFDANSRPGRSINDTVWGILNGRIMSAEDYGRHPYYCMYELLKEEGRRPDALRMLLMVFYIDLSGIQGLCYIDLYRSGVYKQKDVLENFGISITLAPGIVSSIAELQDAYTDEMIPTLYKHKLPVQVCDQKMFTTIVQSILDGTYDESKVTAQLQQAFNRTFRALLQ